MRSPHPIVLAVALLGTSSLTAAAQVAYNPNAYLLNQGAYLGPGYAGSQINPTIAPLVAAEQAQLLQLQQAQLAQQQALAAQQAGTAQAQAAGTAGQSGATPTVVVTDPRNPDLARYSPTSYGDEARLDLVTKAAHGAGIRAGFAEEMERIAASLRDGELVADLDRRYDFASEVTDGIVPPVVAEIHDVAEVASDRRLILTLGSFEIVRPARLATRPPTWRDYLLVEAYSAPAPTAVGPRNGAEQSAWDEAYGSATEIGIREARATFTENLDRLDRDLAGMRRYHELAARGALSLPIVTTGKNKLRISKNGRRADVDERVVELKVTPSFKAASPAAFR
ncbi:MAG: type IV secretion system DotC family protein [Phyllobacteriaceae bacterium]|nr:type IV secretion system DotC family protein [Phyllobacteriaceae bacterium]